MAKQTIYRCSNCGKTDKQWKGVCPKCGEYSTYEETEAVALDKPQAGNKTTVKRTGKSSGAAKPLSRANRKVERFATGIAELDRVLGGGFVGSEVVLIGGEPGAGKSTLSLSIAEGFANNSLKVLYISGEESVDQIALRADRMGVDNDLILVEHSSSLNDALASIHENNPDLLIFDSLQATASEDLSGSAGSLQQSREAATVLTKTCKTMGARALLVSQVNKGGEFSGSEGIQHVVDATLYLDGDRDTPLKFLRAIKNRFGSTDEVGIFQHEDTGLKEVPDPSGVLSSGSETDGTESGAAYGVMSEGARQIPFEVQSLIVPSTLSSPRRQFNGVQHSRAQIVVAILDKFCTFELSDQDVFSSTVLGVKAADPQTDLAVAASMISSELNLHLKDRTAFVGELSLTGQVRGAYQIENKVKELSRLGFDRVFIPRASKNQIKLQGHSIEIEPVSTIRELEKRMKALN